MTTRFQASLGLLTLLSACAGKAETTEQQQGHQPQGNQSVSAQDQKTCDALADSGVDLYRCEALSCCKELTDCSANLDGTNFIDCTINCSTNTASGPDLMTCNQACRAAHPSGYTACAPSTECILRACTTK